MRFRLELFVALCRYLWQSVLRRSVAVLIGTLLAGSMLADNFGLEFHAITPCRVLDTRVAGGLQHSGQPLAFALLGPAGASTPTCGVGGGVQAVSGTVTVVQPSADGFLTLFPAYTTAVPPTSNINFVAGTGALATGFTSLACSGCAAGPLNGFATGLKVVLGTAVPSTAHIIVDITGYYTWTSSLRPWVVGIDSTTGQVNLNIVDPGEQQNVPFDVDWGDGTVNTALPAAATGIAQVGHTYTNHDTNQFYFIRVTSHYVGKQPHYPAFMNSDQAYSAVSF